ncbi:MAG: class I SAM-dependent methyltransferase, partial [Thermoleophilaceae bacterium]
RVGVGAGYILSLASLQLPVLAGGHPMSWAVSVGMPLINGVNLVILARTPRFDRYVTVLAAAVARGWHAAMVGRRSRAKSSPAPDRRQARVFAVDTGAQHQEMPAWPKRFCCDEELARIGYDGVDADRNLAELRADGPRPTTRELIEVIRARGVEGATLLDVGAGVGAMHLALLEAGAARAVDVDASREYLAAARSEADRRGLLDRVSYRYGDLVELAPDLPPIDIATLDSVICCYPYLPELTSAVTGLRPRLVGFTYPRDVWWMRAFMRVYNVVHAVRRSPARYFSYRHEQLRSLMSADGYAEVHDGGIAVWRVVLYERL